MVQLGKGPTMVIDEQTGLSKLNQLKALRATSTTKNTARFGAAELPKVMKAVLMKFSDDVEVSPLVQLIPYIALNMSFSSLDYDMVSPSSK